MLLFTLHILTFLLTNSVATEKSDGLTISTAQGPVAGSFVEPNVRQFLGVPYATAGRWQAPQPPPVRKDTLNALDFGDTCVQQLDADAVEFLTLFGGGGIDVKESEDCHTVNIWSPSLDRKQGTAVLVWVYGGGFMFGSTNTSYYDGKNFVRDNDDITIVSFNYRTNIFGHPNAPQLLNNQTSQNFGALDLDAAIHWVHDNIANFGGDPERISIFGQSAGSVAVDIYAFAHPHDTIVKGMIMESGTISAVVLPTTLNDTPWNNVANAIGCGKVTNAAQLTCMKAAPFTKLKNALISTNSDFGLVNDNITVFSDSEARAEAGNFLKVPLLIGSALNEEDVYVVLQSLVNSGIVLPSISEALSDIATLVTFTCPASVSSRQRFQNKVPTFRYQYHGVFPDISKRPDLRAYHASEIPLVFGTYNSSDSPALATPDEIALSKFMQASWVAFARNPAQGLLDRGWPLYNPNTETLVQLGNVANATGTSLTSGFLVDFACSQPALLDTIQAQITELF